MNTVEHAYIYLCNDAKKSHCCYTRLVMATITTLHARQIDSFGPMVKLPSHSIREWTEARRVRYKKMTHKAKAPSQKSIVQA